MGNKTKAEKTTDLPCGIPTEAEKKPFSAIDSMVAWEEGSLSEEGVQELFQYLIDTGMAWTLQGAYGREAQRLIEAGICHAATA